MTHPDTTAQDKAMRERFEKWKPVNGYRNMGSDDIAFLGYQACAEHFRALLSDPKAVEEVAKAMEPYAFSVLSKGSGRAWANALNQRSFLNSEKTAKRAEKKAQAALLAIRKMLGVV
jgi:hypothetical protein